MTSRIKVMIADDDPLLAAGLAQALSEWAEIEVVAVANDGAEAVRLFAGSRPDVSLVDLSMPRGDGIEVTTQIRALDPAAALLILTGTEDVRSLVRCLELGARGCLRKRSDVFAYGAVAVVASHALPFLGL
jgi:DNA-binding NarL/FixJ family response regulator